MRKKTVGALAGAAAAAVALGSGGTFALWSDSTTVDAGTITAGNLDVDTVGEFEWYDGTFNRDTVWVGLPWPLDFIGTWVDIPTLRADWGHRIDNIDTYRVVPNDLLVGGQGIQFALEGDNLRADLTVSAGDAGAVDDIEGLNVGYVLFDHTNGIEVTPLMPFNDSTTLQFQAGQDGQDDGLPDPGWPEHDVITLPADASLTVVVFAYFDEGTEDRDDTQAQTALDQVDIELEQVIRTAP